MEYKNKGFFIMSKGWDSSMLKKLKSLVGKGLSTAEMGKKLGMSKNAVVGKLNRLGWNTKAAEPVSKKSKPTTKTATKKTETPKSGAKKILKNIVAKVSTKKSTDKKPAKAAVVEKKPAKKEKVEKKPVVTAKEVAIKEKPKTASKKTKKDLALHELLIQHALQMANLKPNQCRWPIGDPDSESFHFCGETVFSGKPYCYEHCRQAYQFTPPKKK